MAAVLLQKTKVRSVEGFVLRQQMDDVACTEMLGMLRQSACCKPSRCVVNYGMPASCKAFIASLSSHRTAAKTEASQDWLTMPAAVAASVDMGR